jgi:proline utilization trans-activator
MIKLDQYYSESQPNDSENLWRVQFFLVVAFGKLFLRRGPSDLGPPGAIDFLHAMKLKPDVLDLWDDPILSIEILCMISLYLFAIDVRSSAYTFVCYHYLLLWIHS